MDIREKFGKRLRELRISQKLTQEKLAERANLHWTYVGQCERGVRNPSLINLQKLARALSVSSGELLPF